MREESSTLLSGEELLVLQLLALGYEPSQIASLLGVRESGVVRCAAGAAGRVGATDWRGAVVRVAQRGLISLS